MRILGHIHTFNDEDVIDRSLRALLDQTYPLQEIVLVDNASTDGTLNRSFPAHVKIIRHQENLGTSGTVIAGMQYAMENQYDWIWLFDADSAPRRDALEKLVDLYEKFPAGLQEQVWLLSCQQVDSLAELSHYAVTFTAKGCSQIAPRPEQVVYEFDATIWSGSLYKLAAVQKIGLPEINYVLDWAEYEYGYRGQRCGYRAFLHQGSIIEHNIGGGPALHFTSYRVGPIAFRMRELPPIRCYYLVRNLLYFWFYEYHVQNVHTLSIHCFKVVKITFNFLMRAGTHWPELSACLRGIWDGLCKNMHKRY